MKTRTKVIIDWSILLIFCVLLFLSLRIVPIIWRVLLYFFEESVSYIPIVFIGTVLLFLLLYVAFARKQKSLSSYVWFGVLTLLFFVVYDYIKDPYDKMHLCSYFIISFLLFRALHHHIFSQKLYFIGVIFSMSLAMADEYAQMFVAGRTFSYGDMFADFAAATLGQLYIALVIKPKLERWRVTLRVKSRILKSEMKWVRKHKHY
ncbi:MAG: VanZ family protein [Candidatus Omnitrophica bacterium]|nr:VanZ family protein [Candidatus Omnitrophota bacterium]